MSDSSLVKHNRTFKKYTGEYRAEVLDALKAYCEARESLAVYEDASIVKVTGTFGEIEEMCAELRTSFGALPGDPEPKEEKPEETD